MQWQTQEPRRKRSVIRFGVALAFVGGLGFWAWHELQLHALASRLDEARVTLRSETDPTKVPTVFFELADVHSNAARAATSPFLSKRYASVMSESSEVVVSSGDTVAKWIETRRQSAWSSIGDELRVADSVTDRDLMTTINRLRAICKAGIDSQDSIAAACKRMAIDPSAVNGIPSLANETDVTATQVHELATVGIQIMNLKKQAREHVQRGLRQADAANQKVGRFERAQDLAGIGSQWVEAIRTTQPGLWTLDSRPQFPRQFQNDLADGLLQPDRQKIEKLLSRMIAHEQHVSREFERALRDEQTLGGRFKRSVGRLADRAANSRIGRETKMSVKTLILGTKMFYDLMDMDSRTDLVQWAGRYNDDMDQLMQEVREVQQMEGWSLTGKNSFRDDEVKHDRRDRSRQETSGNGRYPSSELNGSSLRQSPPPVASALTPASRTLVKGREARIPHRNDKPVNVGDDALARTPTDFHAGNVFGSSKTDTDIPLDPPVNNSLHPARDTGTRVSLGVWMKTCDEGAHVERVAISSPATRCRDTASGESIALEPGDHIIAVNGVRTPTHALVIDAVDAAEYQLSIDVKDKRTGRVRNVVTILRDSEEMRDATRVPLGISLKTCDEGAHVTRVSNRSPATRCTDQQTGEMISLEEGDHILSVNGVRTPTHQSVIAAVHSTYFRVRITVKDSRTEKIRNLIAILRDSH